MIYFGSNIVDTRSSAHATTIDAWAHATTIDAWATRSSAHAQLLMHGRRGLQAFEELMDSEQESTKVNMYELASSQNGGYMDTKEFNRPGDMEEPCVTPILYRVWQDELVMHQGRLSSILSRQIANSPGVQKGFLTPKSSERFHDFIYFRNFQKYQNSLS